MPDSNPQLAIVVPIYRNHDSLTALASEIEDALAGTNIAFLLIFVVDGGPQLDWDVVSCLARKHEFLRALRLETNVGQSRAILRGLAEVDAPYYAVMDADLQDPPSLLPVMLRKAQSENSSVFAERRGSYQSTARMITSHLFRFFMQIFIGLPHGVGTFFVIPSSVREEVLGLGIDYHNIVVMAWLCSRGKYYIPFRRSRRRSGKSATGQRQRIRYAVCSLRCAWSLRSYNKKS
jgi:glycosyltransferase involved in cell wall biosynthesis